MLSEKSIITCEHKNNYMVIGGDSLLGSYLIESLKQTGKKILSTSRRIKTSDASSIYLDLSKDISSWEIPKGIDTVFFCAAVTSIEECWKKPEESGRVNVDNTIALAAKFIKQGGAIIFPSTNLVFDGQYPDRKADDPVCPMTEYGRLNAAAEKKLMDLGQNITIVRFTKIIEPNMPLIKDWIEKLKNKRMIHPFSDMVLAPVPIWFALKAIIEIAEKKSNGIWQVSPKQDITYEHFAYHLARRINNGLKYVRAIKARDSGMEFESIPKHTTLDTSRIEKNLGLTPPDIWESIDSVFGLKNIS
ncbi:MAG: sugar nucleotide-binding protein [bacterium]|nr:sugar nucleotide-binding protein [bacterium]